MKSFFKKFVFILSRAALIGLISLVLLEIVLQIAAHVISKRIHPLTGKESPADGKVRIVMMGDSNTYGLYLEEKNSYPSVFEKLWNDKHGDNPVQVINLGFPGTNSSRVLKSFPEVIRVFSPDIITVMVGANDFWMEPVNVDGVEIPVSPLKEWLKDHLRLYKLFYMLHRQMYNNDLLKIDEEIRHKKFDPEIVKQFNKSITGDAPPVIEDKPVAISYGDVNFDIGFVLDKNTNKSPDKDMENNMDRMASIAESSGVKLVFITYAYFDFPQKIANWQMKAVAKSRKIPIINVAKTFRLECEKSEARCQQLFFPDYHPTAEGYLLLANEIESYFSTAQPIFDHAVHD